MPIPWTKSLKNGYTHKGLACSVPVNDEGP